MTQPERITLDKLKELLNNITRNTNFLFGTETIQTARNYQSISGQSLITYIYIYIYIFMFNIWLRRVATIMVL